MILADTSVWVDHLRSAHPHFSALLYKNWVHVHPWIIGELACGNLANRSEILRRLTLLPGLLVAQEQEVLFLIERHKLMGKGMGYIDAHLVTAALAAGARFWTSDKRLATAIAGLGILYSPPPAA